ncbi:MAG: hypothetical protein ALECFALPRED_007737 [Alectoria fallacina]|uniref:Uncharacterized protein n=1 Tax=Alectoria fallacina TaxID=1903189 RepID=A0A8H3J0V0_9LECA|nr:MAG: hypothetical protein ALECFALPRED_007737 [Alectoria fallacina]
MRKDDKALLRLWQSQTFDKVPKAEDVEMLKAQMNDISSNHGLMIKRYVEDQRSKFRKRFQILEMKSTGKDQLIGGTKSEDGYTAVEEEWQTMGARALRGEV